MRQAVCLFVLLGLATPHAVGGRQQPVVKTTTAGVVIDATVVDRDGHVVLDLGRDDFELTENGVRQQIVSATLVRGGVVPSSGGTPAVPNAAGQASAAPVSPSGAPGEPRPGADNTPSVTAILFDRLSPEMRPLAGRAALAYVGTLSPPHDYAGVFLADTTLKTFQSFTNQAESLRQGVARAASTAPVSLAAGAERAATTRVQGFDPNQPPTAGAESGGGFSKTDRLALMDPNRDRDPAALLLRLELKMGEGYQRFASEYEGQASMTGLRTVIDALGLLPGRKSILYFTENLQVTTTGTLIIAPPQPSIRPLPSTIVT
jgi:VWFA-related protein